MMNIITGIQSTGIPHLGNILGVMVDFIKLSKKKNNNSFCFIADLHSLTTIKDSEKRKKYIFSIAAAWLAFGLDIKKTIFYRQSQISEIFELNWYLNCFTPYPMLSNAHSFKKKKEDYKLSLINSGLFTYPVLMASDVLLFNINSVFIGKDQFQHLEIISNIAKKINNLYGNIFSIPNSKFNLNYIIRGTDGRKMSKSYNNTINIFLPEKLLIKNVMSIITNNIPLNKPKDPNNCNIFNIYKLLSNKNDIKIIKQKYINGNYSYKQAKNDLLDLIITNFFKERKLYNEYIKNSLFIEEHLKKGEFLASNFAKDTLFKIKTKLGY